MPLDATSRARTAAQWQRDNTQPTPFLRAEVAAAIDAVDDWVDSNQASLNNALPAAVKANATVAQKIDLLMYVLLRRQGRLHAEED